MTQEEKLKLIETKPLYDRNPEGLDGVSVHVGVFFNDSLGLTRERLARINTVVKDVSEAFSVSNEQLDGRRDVALIEVRLYSDSVYALGIRVREVVRLLVSDFETAFVDELALIDFGYKEMVIRRLFAKTLALAA